MVLPQAFDNLLYIQCLILGSQQLNVKEVGVVIQEHDKIEFRMWGADRKRSTEIRMDQVQHVLHSRRLGRGVWLLWVPGHDTCLALREWSGMVDVHPHCDQQ